MTTFNNSFEGGTDGTTITTANSGGTSGDAFDTVSIGSGAIATFSALHPAHGSLGYRFNTGATSTSVYVEKTYGAGTPTTIGGRTYYYAPALPSTSYRMMAVLSGTTTRLRVGLSTSGKVQVYNSAGTVVATSTNALSAGTQWRIEWNVTLDSANGTLTLNTYNGDSTTTYDTISLTAQNFGGTTCDRVRFGVVVNAANIADQFLDDIQINDTGTMPGPAGSTTTTVGMQTQVLWNVAAAVGAQCQDLWNVNATVGMQTQELWNVRATVGVQDQLLWNVKAKSVPVKLGMSGFVQGTGSLSSGSLTLTAGCNAGDTVLFFVGERHTSGSPTITDVTDSRGNTYTIDAATAAGAVVGSAFATSTLTTPLVAGDSVSFTVSAAVTNEYVACAYSLPGTCSIDGNSPSWVADSTATSHSFTVNVPTSTDIIIGVDIESGSITNIASTTVGGATELDSYAGTNREIVSFYSYPGVTGNSTVTVTWDTSHTGSMIVAPVVVGAPATTPVGRQTGLAWNTKQVVGAQKQELWNVLVSQTVGYQSGYTGGYGTATTTTVGSQYQTLWNTRAAVGSQKQELWNVNVTVGVTKQDLWNVLTTAGSQKQELWNVRAAVGAQRQELWNTRAVVGAQRQEIWNTCVAVGAQRQELWNVANAVGVQRQELWNVGGTAGAQRQALWNVRIPVGAQRQELWNVTTSVGNEDQYLWNVAGALVAGINMTFYWATREQANYQIKVWDGSSWVAHLVRRWNGTSWVP